MHVLDCSIQNKIHNISVRTTGYITPKDVLAGFSRKIDAKRDRKLEAARQEQPYD